MKEVDSESATLGFLSETHHLHDPVLHQSSSVTVGSSKGTKVCVVVSATKPH
ncbi:hypothetical protein PAMC26577_05520 [Caballeronia sordidicola]|uniref:Uncharacterized protein n=1 Tax=Caballeronia sordidicola TaxID=196367 RepID=A0A242N338_CABSO|nr:hypothetical protein PAMC26577_05520 [Caballeronia sordidicola]